MFTIAILIGIYSFTIFFLGLLDQLYKNSIVLLTLTYCFLLLLFYRKLFLIYIKRFFYFINQITRSRLLLILVIVILLQVLVNFIGALGPELAFDALWYHLTIPKIYLINHGVVHIPGGLLYYSDMPKLTEMLYTASLSFGNEILSKIIHFSFGILSLIALYKLSRKFFSVSMSIAASAIFYSNLVVGWQSTIAYVDLARTFFETVALWGFVNWIETNEKKWLVESAVTIGLAISTKLLAIGSIFIFSSLIFYIGLKKKVKLSSIVINILVYWCISILIVLPWLVFAFIHTGNPIYPFFTNIYKVGLNLQIINPFIHKSDSISILYIITPIILPFVFKKLRPELKIVYLYSVLAFAVWYLTPKTDSGRFILPYLPAFSLLIVAVFNLFKNKIYVKLLLVFVIISSFFSIVYRFAANTKYIPVILDKETKGQFLTKYLNFSFGDFYDTDNFFKNSIKDTDKVLLYGFHNLYYVGFPFIDSSWVQRGDKFNYIATQNTDLPKRFSYWNFVYYNPTTKVKLYSLGGQTWAY